MVERKVYITKNALLCGITEKDSYRESTLDKSLIFVKGNYTPYKIGKDAFFDKEDAIKNAYERRDKKVAELKKQIEKFEKLKFE